MRPENEAKSFLYGEERISMPQEMQQADSAQNVRGLSRANSHSRSDSIGGLCSLATRRLPVQLAGRGLAEGGKRIAGAISRVGVTVIWNITSPWLCRHDRGRGYLGKL